MNKHMIFLPVLLASAVSLHLLSLNLEAQENIANEANNQVGSNIVPKPSVTGNDAQPVKHPETNVSVPVDNQVPSGKTTADQKVVKAENKNVIPAATSKPVSVVAEAGNQNNTTPAKTVISTATPSPASIQIVAGLIPSKNFNDIVREAKTIGGRVDPFLSMKPPEMSKIPELPVFTNVPGSSPNTGKVPAGKDEVTNPPAAWVPDFKDNKPSKSKPKTRIASNAAKNKSGKKPGKEEDIIVFVPETKLEDGLVLTGIITGSKPLAVITVDKESKVLTIGDVVRKKSNLKIVSIDSDTQSITIADEKNRRAKLGIKD